MKNIYLVLMPIFLIFLTLVSTKNIVLADSYGQYQGTPPSQTIIIEKTVAKPNQTITDLNILSFVKNLTTSDPRFKPGQQVVFKLRVKNTSTVAVTNVQVKDFIPSSITPIEGPGSFDENSRVISFNAGDFAPGEEKVYFIRTQVLSQDKLPADQGLFCQTNKAQVITNSIVDEDTSQFCIEKQVTGALAVPTAGPELGIFLLAGQLLTLGAGTLLKRIK